jgi:hypothetical protein
MDTRFRYARAFLRRIAKDAFGSLTSFRGVSRRTACNRRTKSGVV